MTALRFTLPAVAQASPAPPINSVVTTRSVGRAPASVAEYAPCPRRTPSPEGRHRRRLQHGASPSPAPGTMTRHPSPWWKRSGPWPTPAFPRKRSTVSWEPNRGAGRAGARARGLCTRRPSQMGIPALLDAAALVTTGQCDVVLIAAGGAGDPLWIVPPRRPGRGRPTSSCCRGHMDCSPRPGVRPHGATSHADSLRHRRCRSRWPQVAAVIRNNGHANPDAVYAGKGPFSPADILASRMIADPFHLPRLDCATTSEGGCGTRPCSGGSGAAPCVAARVDPWGCQ